MDMKKAKELYEKSDDKNVGLQPQPRISRRSKICK